MLVEPEKPEKLKAPKQLQEKNSSGKDDANYRV